MIEQELQSIFAKINAITKGSSVLNPLERDLVKDYLLQAYRIVDHQPAPDINVSPKVAPAIIQKKEPPATEPVAQVNPVLHEEPMIIEAMSPEPVKAEPISNGTTAHIGQDDTLLDLMQAPPIDKRYNKIFEWEEGQDLSDQLSKVPIADLQRAFGINDRLRYQNELFDGDAAAFNDALDTLNKKPDFISAKSFVARHLIDRYQWLAESQVETAREFTKLLSRRFSQ